MDALFELWDADGGNLVGAYDTEDAALADVAETVYQYGVSAAIALFLGVEEGDGTSKTIATGAPLLDRALSRFPRGLRVDTRTIFVSPRVHGSPVLELILPRLAGAGFAWR